MFNHVLQKYAVHEIPIPTIVKNLLVNICIRNSWETLRAQIRCMLKNLSPSLRPKFLIKNKLSVYMHDSRADSRVLNGFLTRNQC